MNVSSGPTWWSWCWGGPDLHWSETVVTPAPCEPVSIMQVRHRLRIVHDADDYDLALLIRAARAKVEQDTSAVLVSRTIDQTVDAPPAGTSSLLLTRWPVKAVTQITTYGTDGVPVVLPPTSYRVDTSSRPARVFVDTWPTTRARNAVTVRYDAGFAGTPMPVQTLTWANGIADVDVAAPPTFLAGDMVAIRGADQPFYNGAFVVRETHGNDFTVAIPVPAGWPDPPSPATGNIIALDLPTPETFLLAVLALVTHWWDPLRRGLTTAGGELPLPFGYDDLTADRLEWLA